VIPPGRRGRKLPDRLYGFGTKHVGTVISRSHGLAENKKAKTTAVKTEEPKIKRYN